MRRRAVILLLWAVPIAGAAAVPTADELQQKFDAKDWPAVLQMTGRLLSLQGAAAANVDRVDAWMKKGEAQLQSNQFVPAAVSFEKAAAEPKVDQDRSDLALATAELARRSDHRGYHPVATKQMPQPPSYDILDITKRPTAFAALCDVQTAAATEHVDRFKDATDEPPLAGLIKEINLLRPLDRVVHKSAEQSDALEKLVATHFATAAQDWATKSSKALTDIKTAADQTTETVTRLPNGRVQRTTSRKGTTPAQQADIRKIVGEGQRLAGVYLAVQKLLDAPSQDALKPAQPAIQTTYDQAKAMMNEAFHPGAAP